MLFLKAVLGSLLGTFLMLGAVREFHAVEPAVPSEDPQTWRVIDRQRASLRELAARRGLYVGTAVRERTLRNDPELARLIAREFNMLVPENELKMGPTQRKPARWNFKRADRIVAFAERHGMAVRGHTLVWHAGVPEWWRRTEYGPEVLRGVLVEHIERTVGHFRGRVVAWDVVNEAVSTLWDDLRDTKWRDVLGDDYIDLAFRTAHAADPGAKLFYNDFLAEDMGAKADRVYELVRGLQARGVPIHGVGLQAHLHFAPPPRHELIANLQRLAALGLEIHLTEIDGGIPEPVTVERRRRQAILYRRLIEACLSVPRCTAVLVWGASDRVHWITEYFAGFAEPALFGGDLQPKLPYFGWADALGRWPAPPRAPLDLPRDAEAS